MDEGWAIIIAAVLAILGIFYASRQQRKLLRKQHTYQVIEKLNDWREFDEKLEFARALIRAGKVPKICEGDDKASCDQIDWLLNYYEFLSSAVIAGDIDEGLVRRVEETRLCRVYLKFIEYVEENREDMDTTKLWENLEFLCHRWITEDSDLFDKIVSLIALRPSTVRFHADRESVRDQLRSVAATLH